MRSQPLPFLLLLTLFLLPASALAQGKKDTTADPYTLTTCPISGKKLGSMGDPVVKSYDGREVRFCCGGCVGTFEKDKASQFKKINDKLIADQKAHYPIAACVVSKESLTEKGKDAGIDVVIGNRLVRLCCEGCTKKLLKNPKKYLARLDKAIVKVHGSKYPLDTCVVGGGKLGSMGKPVETVIGNRLVRLCCKGCLPKLKANPHKYLPKLDAAWKHKAGAKSPHKGHEGQGHNKGGHDHSKHKH